MNQEVLRDLSYGVYVVTTLCPESQKPAGCIANSIMQVTYDTIAVSINHENFTNSCIKESGKFAISILGETVADNIIPVFGFQSARNVDKFVGIKTKNIDGLEIIEDSVGYIICDVIYLYTHNFSWQNKRRRYHKTGYSNDICLLSNSKKRTQPQNRTNIYRTTRI